MPASRRRRPSASDMRARRAPPDMERRSRRASVLAARRRTISRARGSGVLALDPERWVVLRQAQAPVAEEVRLQGDARPEVRPPGERPGARGLAGAAPLASGERRPQLAADLRGVPTAEPRVRHGAEGGA